MEQKNEFIELFDRVVWSPEERSEWGKAEIVSLGIHSEVREIHMQVKAEPTFGADKLRDAENRIKEAYGLYGIHITTSNEEEEPAENPAGMASVVDETKPEDSTVHPLDEPGYEEASDAAPQKDVPQAASPANTAPEGAQPPILKKDALGDLVASNQPALDFDQPATQSLPDETQRSQDMPGDEADFSSMVDNYLGSFMQDFDRDAYLKERGSRDTALIQQHMKDNQPVKAKKHVAKGEKIVLLGKAIQGGHVIPIDEITGESGRVIVEGEICATEAREIRGERIAFSFDVTDFNNTITAKKLFDKKEFGAVKEKLVKGIRVKMRGEALYDKYARDITITPYDVMQIEKEERMDDAEEKRVELHLHTNMSAMDGMSSVKDLVSRAAKWGHKAVAITDHGVVQAFPDAHLAAKKSGIKIIYGTECYLVNDSAPIVDGEDGRGLTENAVVFDIETTGLSALSDAIIEIGAVKIIDGEIRERYQSFIDPQRELPAKIVELTHITPEMVKGQRTIDKVLPEFFEFVGDFPVIAHNASFDCGFIKINAKKLGLKFDNCIIDTLEMGRRLLPDLRRHKLDVLAKHFDVKQESHHRADDDARVTGEIYLKMAPMMREKGIETVSEINTGLLGAFDYKKARSFHCIILVKSHEGLMNLYQLISKSHLEYFYKTPRILKSMLSKYRDGLIIGSACEAGELYRAILDGRDNSELNKIVRFYDYLEIQPLGNNQFLIDSGRLNSEDDLKQINRKIIELGRYNKKMTVATCDVHFLDPKDEVFRRILMTGQGFKDADKQAPLYLRTTDEMLAEFSYLGPELAREVVIENPNKIADLVEAIKPIPDETFPPEIEGAQEDLIRMSEEKAIRIYGENLPEIVKERMDRELHSITKYGFAVMYMIAQKLVAKSLSDGYLVGSRGSVGSSFIAFLSGITEVNALPPHYVCEQCKYSEFVENAPVSSGCDLEDKTCPVCGQKLKKDGHDIPFETFLGFEGDKEPDIDLNFSGDYQPVAHKYTEELFGEGHVFRAGTIGTIAEKTAYGFVKKYFEGKGIVKHNAEVNRLVQGCTGVKRTTGQHPGGVMILPRKNEIYEFCPIQHPADDVSTEIITTHFDYHSISGRLLKLDILGHDDPTMIRMLEDLTGVDAKTIPIDDPETMNLFLSPDALKVTKEEIRSETGTYAVPEFGTKFVRQMLVDTKPTTFGELVRISGLSHGTDVWLNNAQDLVRSGTCTLKDSICTRDDIMLYLIQKGLPKKTAFDIMEKVRKGKGVTDEHVAIMKEHDVPDWYIASCKKIKYMFPKAHAVAYVTMAFRIAWFKVHYPIEFYQTYFTVRADEFDYELMAKGVSKVVSLLDEYEARGNDITAKEKNVVTILEVCLEMYRRGIEFTPIRLYESDAVKFLNRDGKILPPLSALAGLGETAARSVVEEREKEEFFSKEDLLQRCKISKTILELMTETGCLEGLPDSSQLTLF